MTTWILKHSAPEDGVAPDETLQEQQDRFLIANPCHRIVSSLIGKIRVAKTPWWTPEEIRQEVSISSRLQALIERPDRRQYYVMGATGLRQHATRKKSVDDQADLIDLCINSGDTPTAAFENSFLPNDYVCYMDPRRFWTMFMERYPWDQEKHTDAEINLIAWLIDASLAPHTENEGTQLLSHLDVLSTIPSEIWLEYIHTDLHCQVRDARYDAERSSRAFGPIDEMAIVSAHTISERVPHSTLRKIAELLEKRHNLSILEPSESSAVDYADHQATETMPSPAEQDGPPVGRLNTPVPETIEPGNSGIIVDTSKDLEGDDMPEEPPPGSDDDPIIPEERPSQQTLTPPARSIESEEDALSESEPPSSDAPNPDIEETEVIVFLLEQMEFGFKGLSRIGLEQLRLLQDLLLNEDPLKILPQHTLAMATMLSGRMFPINPDATARQVHDAFLRMVGGVNSSLSARILAAVQTGREQSIPPPLPPQSE